MRYFCSGRPSRRTHPTVGTGAIFTAAMTVMTIGSTPWGTIEFALCVVEGKTEKVIIVVELGDVKY
jgi:hypothetical protein